MSQIKAGMFRAKAKAMWATVLALLAGTPLLGQAADAANPPRFAAKSNLTLGLDPTGRVCSGRRLYGDPLLRNGKRDIAYDISCGRAGSVGRVYLLGSVTKEAGLQAWQQAVAPLCVAPRPQPWSPQGLVAELGLFCGGGTAVGARPATMLLAASGPAGLLLGDASPTAAPVIELAMRVLAGVAEEPTKVRQRGPRSALLDDLQAALGGELSGGGLADFSSLRAAAFENNSIWLFGSAELQFADAVRLHAGLWPEDYAGRADLQSERAINLANQRRFTEAERVLADAEQNAARSQDSYQRAKVAAYLALAALNAGRYTEVVSRANRARELIDAWRRSGEMERAPADQAGRLPQAQRALILESQLLRALAVAAERTQDVAAGRTGLAQAVEVAARTDLRVGGWLQSGLAQDRAALELRDGRPEAAVQLLSEALAKYRQIALGTRIEANLLMDLGIALQRQGAAADAMARFAEAFEIYREQTENRGVSPQRGMPYLDALAAQLPAEASLEQAAPLFAAFETLAQPAVAQTAAATAARLVAGPNGSVIRGWQDADRGLRRALTRLSNLATDAPLEQRRAAETEVAEWRTRAETMEQQMNTLFPNFGLLTLEPVGLDALRSALGPGERLVRLALGEEHGIGLLLDRDSARVFRVGLGESRAAELVTRLKRSVRDETATFEREASRELFEGLFGAIRPALFAANAPERLIIDVGGALASLPFTILLSGDAEDDAEPWLARRFAVMSVPSMRAFVSARTAGASPGTIPFIGFGDFLPLAGATAAEDIVRSTIARRRLPAACGPRLEKVLAALPRLEGTAEELAAVRAVFEVPEDTVRLREQFTDRSVQRERRLESSRIVMFSTHGVFGTEFPEAEGCVPDAALLTSSLPDGSTMFLDSAQVLDLKLDADLVVLSACDTGNPQPVIPGETGLPSGGDALSGLARSFFYAGARSVMVSHWPLPDEATVPLIRAFFSRLRAGDAAPEALRNAQLEQMQAGRDDPLEWAALVVVGAPTAR